MPTQHEKLKREQERARKRQERRMLLIGGGVVVLVLVATLVVMASGVLNPQGPATATAQVAQVAGTVTCSAVQTLPDQGRDHIADHTGHPDYNSNPPTSGWHWANPLDWGIYTSQQFQEQLIHNLEHGGIVIQYNDLTAADVQRLTNLVNRDSYHMILAPYPGLPAGVRVAWTAWTH
ncbi:MAG TPA: DUF3105 domain-containing protein, partial [Anaerolineae bacterium]